MSTSRIALSAALAFLVQAGAAAQTPQADNEPHRQRVWYASLIGAQWGEVRLPQFPIKAVTGDIPFRQSYLAAAGIGRVIVPRFDIPIPFTGVGLVGNSLEIEGQVVRHFGLQEHWEGTAALVLRTGELRLWGGASLNIGWANGLSYAFSDPKYEFGPGGVRGVDSRRLQYYMGLEAEFTLSQLPNVHLLAKLHHRSGIYGVISPRRTGSNFIGGGLRVDLM